MFVLLNVSCAVYFNQLEEEGKDITYTIRFPYELSFGESEEGDGWSTAEVTQDFTSTFIRNNKYDTL